MLPYNKKLVEQDDPMQLVLRWDKNIMRFDPNSWRLQDDLLTLNLKSNAWLDCLTANWQSHANANRYFIYSYLGEVVIGNLVDNRKDNNGRVVLVFQSRIKKSSRFQGMKTWIKNQINVWKE